MSHTPTREFEFTSQDFAEIRALIHSHAGIYLTDAKMDMVYSRLARRLRATGLKSFRDYLARLKSGDEAEWEAFVNSLTTNLTAFFREAHHFAILREFLAERQARPITIWSAACSTGEEAYSIAMTAAEVFPNEPGRVRVIASDLDTQVLARAREGIYPMEKVERLSLAQRQRFFLKGKGERAGFVRVRPEIQAMVSFLRVNLLDAVWPVREPLDAIFCRNVMIYFDKPTQERLVGRFSERLEPGGWLLIGHSEGLMGVRHELRYVKPAVYRKPAEGQGAARGGAI